MPVSSPCAPAAGWSADRAHAGDLGEDPLELPQELERPLERPRPVSGWRLAKPGSRAAPSLSFGLYFIVHEPSG